MSIVERSRNVRRLQRNSENDAGVSLRTQVKAGLTGYAQVYGKYNTTFYDKLLMDLTYIAKTKYSRRFGDYAGYC